jgi:hypothetical protein
MNSESPLGLFVVPVWFGAYRDSLRHVGAHGGSAIVGSQNSPLLRSSGRGCDRGLSNI